MKTLLLVLLYVCCCFSCSLFVDGVDRDDVVFDVYSDTHGFLQVFFDPFSCPKFWEDFNKSSLAGVDYLWSTPDDRLDDVNSRIYLLNGASYYFDVVYNISVTASGSISKVRYAETYVLVRLLISEVHAFIDGGNVRNVASGNDIALDGSHTLNPDNVPVKYQWNCLHEREDFFREECPFSIPNREKVLLSQPEEGTYFITLSVIPDDMNYETSEYEVEITVTPTSKSSVLIRSIPPGKIIFDPDEKILFETDHSAAHINGSWKINDRTSSQDMDLLSVAIYHDNSKIVISPASLMPGHKYVVIYQDSKKDLSEYSFTLDIRPSISCTLNPDSGYFVITEFDIACTGEDIELYTIYLANPLNNILLTHRRNSTLQVHLQPLSDSKEDFSFIIRGENSRGIISEDVILNFEVSPSSEITLPGVVEDLWFFTDLNIRLKSYSTALTDIVMLASVLPLYHDLNVNQLREELLNYVQDVKESPDIDSPLKVAEALFYIFKVGNTTESILDIGFDLLEDLLIDLHQIGFLFFKDNLINEVLMTTSRTVENILTSNKIDYINYSVRIRDLFVMISNIQFQILQPGEKVLYLHDLFDLRFFKVPSSLMSSQYLEINDVDFEVAKIRFPKIQTSAEEVFSIFVQKYNKNIMDDTLLASPVLGVSVLDDQNQLLSNVQSTSGYLILSFTAPSSDKKRAQTSQLICHKWDEENAEWKSDGCATGLNSIGITCECEDYNGYFSLVNVDFTAPKAKFPIFLATVIFVLIGILILAFVILFIIHERRRVKTVIWTEKDLSLKDIESSSYNSIELTSEDQNQSQEQSFQLTSDTE